MDTKETKLGSDALIKTLDATIAASEQIRGQGGEKARRQGSGKERTKALHREITAPLNDLDQKKSTRNSNPGRRSKAS